MSETSVNQRKVAMIGCGFVGSATAFALMESGLFSEMVLIDAVRTLPENYRNAVYLHYYEGYTAAEVGRMMGAPTNTVLSWLRRARAQLHTMLKEEIEDEVV